MDTTIPLNDLGRSWAARDARVAESLVKVLQSGWWVLGGQVTEFERALSEYVGADDVIGVGSGTDALILAMTALGLPAGSEIVVAANAGGYASVAAARAGFRVAYADVDPRTLLLTASTIEPALGPETRGIVVTHLFGNVAEMDAIMQLAHGRGIRVIEDCAQSLGARYREGSGERVGSRSDISCFSFYPTKNLGAVGDGGAVATSDRGLAARVRALRQYGWTAKYLITEPGGMNSRLDELQAAVLLEGLPLVDELNRTRISIANRYRAALLGAGQVQMVTGSNCLTVAHLAVVRCAAPDVREELNHHLTSLGIQSAIHYPIPDSRQPGLPPPVRIAALPITEAAASEILTVPCFPELSDAEIQRVADALGSFASTTEPQ